MTTPPAGIAPYRLDIPETTLEDLRTRLRLTRWPSELSGVGWERGVPVDYVREVAEYWESEYDWRAAEAAINRFPQYTTTIDGQHIHFLHVHSAEPGAVPLILTHGWPGSIVEFLDLIGPLTDPRAHGGDAADAFHVVVPSIPGFGLSGPTAEPGWGTGKRIARAWAELMNRLGYDQYFAHGGDFGALITRELGVVDADHVTAIHLTDITGTPSAEEADLSDPKEKLSLELQQRYLHELSGYGYIQATRPQTLAYGLTDSPVGQLAWIIEKFKEWTDTEGLPEDAVDRDTLLTNVMLYWLTGTAGSSANLYYEGAQTWGQAEEPSATPTGVAVFPKNIALPIRRVAERNNAIVHWSEFDRGGHFAALEVPETLTKDIRVFVREFRTP